MKAISAVKKDIEFNTSLHSIVGVLKSIAVSEFHLLEQRIRTFEQFSAALETFFDLVNLELVQSPFVSPGNRPTAVVAVTSDQGLLGGLNNHVMMAALNELGGKPGKLVVVGERGEVFVREHNISAVVFPGIKDEYRYAQAMELRTHLANEVRAGQIGALKIIYPRPISFTVQRVEMLQFLPYRPANRKELAPEDYAWMHTIWESHPNDMVEYLLYLLLGQKLYEVFGWSRLAELAARFVHLEESSQKLQELNRKLRLEYFRIRHELIDRNMRELFAARSLFAHGK
ncbi:MAG: FoF1 ATP synthase subunit gamma [Candidatus Omnitrophota bacterium]